MIKGIVIKPYLGFKVGETIYVKESNLTFNTCIDIYASDKLSSFVVTTWDMDELNECIEFN